MRAVVIHPDPMGCRILQFVLSEAGYDEVVLVHQAIAGRQAVVGQEVDLVVVGTDFADGDATHLCAELRSRRYAGPLVLMSAGRDISTTLAAFAAGVDDVIAEPVTPQELVARLHAIGRRYRQEDQQALGTILKVGDAELSVTDLVLRIAGRSPIHLTPTEMRLLECLMRNAGLGVDRETLIERVWGFDFFGGSNRVDVYMRRLRNKIERDSSAPEYLHTIRGVGYTFRPTTVRSTRAHAVIAPDFTNDDDEGSVWDEAAGN